jgi:WD40 repeat protein
MKKIGLCLLLVCVLTGCVRATVPGSAAIHPAAALSTAAAATLAVIPTWTPSITPIPLPTGTPTPDPNLVQDFSARHVWSPDGNAIAVGSQTGLRIFDTNQLELQKELLSEACCQDIVYRSTRLGAIYHHNSQVGVWDLSSGQSLFSLVGKTSEFQSLAISPDGSLIAIGKQGGIQVYRIEDGKVLYTFPVEGFASNVAFDTQGTMLIAAVQWDSAIFEWDLQSQQQIGYYIFPQDVLFFTFSPDASRMMVDYGQAGLELWSLGAISSQYYYTQITGASGSASFNHSNRRVAVWGYTYGGGSALAVWDLYSGEQVHQFVVSGSEHPEWRYVSFSPDDQRLALSDDHGRLIISEVESGTEKVKITLPYQFNKE